MSSYSTGSGSIPAGTAVNFVEGAISKIEYPVIQFWSSSQFIGVVMAIVGIGMVCGLALVTIKVVFSWFKRSASKVCPPSSYVSDFDAIKGRALSIGARRNLDDVPLSFIDNQEYRRSRDDKASNYGK